MPLIRELDPSAGPLNFFGAELRRWRTAAGLSQEQLGQRVGYSGALVGKIETGERAPSPDFARHCDQALPAAGGLFARIYQLARRWDGGYPSWFTEWLSAEQQAISLRTWEPMLIPGLLQTPEYARALFVAWRSADSDEELDQLVQARIDRQAIFDRPKPPALWAVLDEAVLQRSIGSPKIMHGQLMHLFEAAERPKITIQVIPADVGAHVGLLGAFAIAGLDGGAGIVYMESPDQAKQLRSPPWSPRSARSSTP